MSIALVLFSNAKELASASKSEVANGFKSRAVKRILAIA